MKDKNKISLNVVPLLWLTDPRWPNITTQSPQVVHGFTRGVVHSVHLHICKMMYNPHYSIMQSIFTPLKNLYSAY